MPFIPPPTLASFAPSSLHSFAENPPEPGWYGSVYLRADPKLPQRNLRYWDGEFWSVGFLCSSTREDVAALMRSDGRLSPAVWYETGIFPSEELRDYRDRRAWVYPWW